MIADPVAFILAETRLRPVPHAPEIMLHVADEATELWQKTEEELGEIGLAPPFWAFAWAGGQALARYILDHPETVRGRRVLDFASGSGLVAIAAMKAGAAEVTACDIDPFAIAAIGVNAEANGVAVAPLAAGVTEWLLALSNRGATVLIGDPGRSYLPKDRLESLAVYEVPVTRTLEDSDIKKSSVWRFRQP